MMAAHEEVVFALVITAVGTDGIWRIAVGIDERQDAAGVTNADR